MFLPIGDAPNPRTTPWVTYALLALNVAVFALVTWPLAGRPADPQSPVFDEYLQHLTSLVGRPLTSSEVASNVSAYDLVVYEHGFRPAHPSFLALLTCMFLHGGLLHLAGNMLFLWIYGDNVEHRLGRVGYLLAYLGTGVAATAAQALLDPDSNVPVVGASGAISGVLGLYFVFFPRNIVRVMVAFVPFFLRVFEIPARWVLGLYVVLDNLLPLFLEADAEGGVAHGAHLGGFVAGLGAAWWLDRRERTAVPREFRGARVAVDDGARAAAEVLEDLQADAVERAAQRVFSGGARVADALPPSVLLELAHRLAQRGNAEAALTLYRRVLAREPRGPLAAEAHAGAADVQARGLGRTPSAFQHFVDAVRSAPSSQAAEHARDALERIAVQYKPHLRDQRWR